MDVLFVEDEPLVREVVSAGLRDAGLEVVEASSAEEALTLADRQALWPRVVVTDLHLAGRIDGLALGSEVLRKWPGIGVVYATGNPHEFDGRILGPCERYVVKPYETAALLRAVRRVLPACRS
jgi:CheY-like chemotaxis protein